LNLPPLNSATGLFILASTPCKPYSVRVRVRVRGRVRLGPFLLLVFLRGQESGGEASEGKGERGPEPPARQASYYAALMEEAAWELEGREGEGIVSTMDGEMAPEDDKGVVHQSSLSAPSLVAEVTDEEGVGNS
jgi:hypothetical protein